MRFLSVCSGIEAASQAWHPLGWKAVAFAEIEKFPSAVLAHHYPGTPNLGDMSKFEGWPDYAIDLLVGGTPCQSFSVAGLRKGLDDPRGNLMLTYLAIARRYQPRWLVWENVPGVLSSNGGRDFGTFVRGLEELGYHAAWRVLDAQYVRTQSFPWAVPQRRRRVFVVGYLGDWRRAAAVLFDGESLRRDPPPSRETGEGPAPTISARPSGGGGLGTDFDLDGGLVQVAPTLRAGGNKTGGDRPFGTDVDTCDSLVPVAFDCKGTQVQYSEDGASPTLRSMGHNNSHQNAGGHAAVAIQERAVSENLENGPQGKGYQEGIAYTLEARNKVQSVAFAENSRAELRLCGGDGAVSSQLTTGGGKPGQGQPVVAEKLAVRRLMPRECERLQGFPDDFTRIPWRGKGPDKCPDGPRYKALGNSMAVNVMQWIGERVEMVENLNPEKP